MLNADVPHATSDRKYYGGIARNKGMEVLSDMTIKLVSYFLPLSEFL